MCVAIVKTIGAKVSDQTLENCLRFNRDGFGFAYLRPKGKGNEIMVYKSLSFTNFKEALREREAEYPNSPMLIHFRAMSKGLVSMNNCHPFSIDGQHVFIHNGTIGKAPADPDGHKSDTVMFNETTMKLMPKGWFGNPALKVLIEDYIGLSKLAVMNNKGDFDIFNEQRGTWDGDVWYSNDQFKTPPKYKAPEKKATTQHQDTRKVQYGDKDEYDENVDYDFYNNEHQAFHGQNRYSIASKRYEKFDHHANKWIDLVIWNNKYLLALKDADKADSYPDNYELSIEQIELAAKNAGVEKTEEKFELKLSRLNGGFEIIKFERCQFCWLPEYAYRLHTSDLKDSDVSYELCDECHHNMKAHGALED